MTKAEIVWIDGWLSKYSAMGRNISSFEMSYFPNLRDASF